MLIHRILKKKAKLAHLKSDVDKLDIDILKTVPINLSNLKSKVDKLDVDKLVSVPVDLNKFSDLVKNDVKDMMNWLKKLTLFRLLTLVI